MLIKEIVPRYQGRVKYVNEDWGTSRLAERFGIKKYPVVFVDDVLIAKPEDFGGWGDPTGKYAPWQAANNRAKFQSDLTRMIDLLLRGNVRAAKKNQTSTNNSAELSALPAFAAQDLQGVPVNSAALAGRVVVVEFWATWCGPCRSTLSWLGDVKQRYGDKVEVIAIAVESEEKEIRQLTQSLNLPFRVVTGTNDLVAPFGTITSVPTMFVFDQRGKTAATFYGAPQDLHERAGQVLDSLFMPSTSRAPRSAVKSSAERKK